MNNRYFQRALDHVSSWQNHAEKIPALLTTFSVRLSKAVRHHPKVRAAMDQFQLLARMARAYADGRYPHIPWSALVRILAALVYFVNPFDLLPDVLPLIGFTDDVTVLLWVMKSVAGEIEAFSRWEKNQSLPA